MTTDSIRPIDISYSLLTRVDGSAKFSAGNSTVLCSVTGPADVRIRDEKLDKATLDVIVRPAVGVAATKETSLAYILRTTFETVILLSHHPRTQIQVVAQIISDDGSIISHLINATTMALLDAGVPMKAVVVGVGSLVDDKGRISIDPTADEVEKAVSTHNFAFDSVSLAVLYSESTGVFTEEQVKSDTHDLW
ncbi:1568_t:CDS:2 [Paraglomus brasilianum]|uniref:1568_t:CDS:1 n=1 Tax=Paraglomus brasilianum TaxID=144538 RepID=A0A9N9AXG1_9GLOM|nr:1568_t:CDS:2 [Paraglomus brasilianum]